MVELLTPDLGRGPLMSPIEFHRSFSTLNSLYKILGSNSNVRAMVKQQFLLGVTSALFLHNSQPVLRVEGKKYIQIVIYNIY